MSFNVRNNGIIRVSSDNKLLHGRVKNDLHLMDMVMIRRPSRSRKVKYGFYIGRINEKILVRTIYEDELLEENDIVPIIPHNDLLDYIQATLQNIITFGESSTYSNFYLAYLTIQYPDIFTTIAAPSCSICGSIENLRTFRNRLYCESCFDTHTSYCDLCGERTLTVELIDGECEPCHKRLRVLPYHRNQPKLKFFGDNKNNEVPYLGVELEVAYGGESNSNVAKILPLINTDDDVFMYCSHDSSLTDGFENITQPATLEYHLSLYDKYLTVFNKLRELDYSSHDSGCCGFHVHFNRDFFNSSERVQKLCDIIATHWENIFKFSRRQKSKINHFARPWWEDMSTNTYVNNFDMRNNHSSHYYALNIGNDNTIEFRMFRGTLNIQTFFATLELVNNMVIAAKYKTSEELQSMNFEDFLTSDTSKNYWTNIQNLSSEL